MSHKDREAALSVESGSFDKIFLPQRKHITADESRVLRPACCRQCKDPVFQARSKHTCHGNGQNDPGESEKDIHDAHDDLINPAAGKPADDADRTADNHRKDDDDEGGKNRAGCTCKDPRPDGCWGSHADTR